ncbi:MAG: glycosyltransferase [Clostridia bacterium]|nr:glycosyltransferase [Clostridia bacterium]
MVVSDDGSTDRTIEILDSFAKAASFPVRVYRNPERLGYSRNFERAIELCSGDIIFLCDQDDVWFPEKVKTVLQAFQAPEHPLVVGNNAELTDADLRPTGLTAVRQLSGAGLRADSFVWGCCTAFLAELRVAILPIPHDCIGHDGWIHRVALTLDRRVLLPQPLQYFRRHGSNASHWFVIQTRRVTILDRVKHYAPGDTRAACKQRLAQLEMLSSRLRDRGRELETLLGEDLELNAALERIRREQQAVMRRLAMLALRGPSRWVPAWRMLRAGDYSYFSGWMSLVKDLVQ